MSDLSVVYMGRKLDNPLVVSSCGLVKNIEGVRRCAAAGAGAVVLKSLFEEQLQADSAALDEYAWLGAHSEALDYVRNTGMELGPQEYLELIRAAKNEVGIPIFASLNCVSPRWWNEYAQRIQAAGADGIELNMALLPSDPRHGAQKIEEIYLRIMSEVKRHVSIPVAVKLGPYFTALAHTARELVFRGAAAMVLFNRFYTVDIDIDTLEIEAAPSFSTPADAHLPLRWISLLSGRLECDLAASSGVHHAPQAIRMLLAGATVVQLCSTLYRHGVEHISVIHDEIRRWMERHGFETLADFRGILSQMASDHPERYERMQYIKALVGIE